MRWPAIVHASFCFMIAANTGKVTGARADAAGASAAGDHVLVTASVPGEALLAPALAELAAAVLRASGLPARAVPPPPACAPPHRPDSRECRRDTVGALASGRLHVALMTVPAGSAPVAWLLRDAGLDELGDVAPPLRRVCFAAPPAHSLLDLADDAVAAHYQPDLKNLNLTESNSPFQRHPHEGFSTEELNQCHETGGRCASVLTSDESEAALLADVAKEYHLKINIIPTGRKLNTISSLSNKHIICDWTPESTDFSVSPLRPLGPPPCGEDFESDECVFESRRLQKLINTRALARFHIALRALVRLRLSSGEMRELNQLARVLKPADAATRFLNGHPARVVARQLRVAVLLPNATHREVYNAPALAAAAALVERDLEKQWSGVIRFKVEIYDDQCDAAQAYQYMSNALGNGEYGALSGVAGPACGAAFADVARQAPALGMPALAYTPQAPPAGALALLAAGDGRAVADALAALLSRMHWSRLVALSEPATRPVISSAALKTDLIAHLELPADRPDYHPDIFTQWVERVRRTNGRIVFVCAEDARAVRAALCAGRGAGLAVWVLPAALTSSWLTPGPHDRCDARQLADVADGHLSFAPEWMLPWLDNVVQENASDVIGENESVNHHLSDTMSKAEAWRARWRAQCRYVGGACERAGPHAPLLYDALRLWAGALEQTLRTRPTTIDALHDPTLARSLIINATKIPFVGLTGHFAWTPVGEESEGTAFARHAPLVLMQWRDGKRYVVGRWVDRNLTLTKDGIRWRTADGRAPDDGDEECSIQALAEFLHSDCPTAFVSLAVFLLASVVIALGGTAVYCKRRAEREYRARLERALGLRSLLPKAVGLDRWEVPRERVVINRKLGMGAFGTVYGGHALLAEDRGWTAVAVKTLKAGATTEEKLDFLSEAEAMKRFDHKNVVRLLGVVTKTEPVCTVMEFMLYGDLKNYLLARRHLAVSAGEDAEEQVSARRLTAMALDVARALSYLAQLRYVHRDVAARNCLVSARRVVKLADFGMTRLVFENDYYRFSRKGMLPVRWMAPESLALGVFSPASDVWSFGVLLYEIVTFGSLPFQGFSNSEVLERVKSGCTLDLPAGLKPQLEGLIRSCWQQDHKVRPTASEVAAFLADAPRLLAPCLDVPIDALPLDADPPWRLPRECAEARWVSWAAPASTATDTTYLSAEGPRETDQFLP